MAWTTEDVEKLQAAIAAGGGVRSVAFADQQVTFSSVKEMLDLLSVIKAEVNASTRRNFRLASVSKGV